MLLKGSVGHTLTEGVLNVLVILVVRIGERACYVVTVAKVYALVVNLEGSALIVIISRTLVTEHKLCGVVIARVGPGVNHLTRGINSAGDNACNGGVTGKTGVTDPENGVNAIILKNAKLHGVGGVDENDNSCEVLLKKVDHILLSLSEKGVGISEVAILRACS